MFPERTVTGVNEMSKDLPSGISYEWVFSKPTDGLARTKDRGGQIHLPMSLDLEAMGP